MSWLQDLLNPRKRFCCGKNAQRQRFAQKWDKAKQRSMKDIIPLSDRARIFAEEVMEKTPQVDRFYIEDGGGVTLDWIKGKDTLTLYIHPHDKELDQLNIIDLWMNFKPVTIKKINELLGEK